MATSLRAPLKGVITYADMTSGIDLDLNTTGKSIAKLIGTDFDDLVQADVRSANQTVSTGGGNDMIVAGGFMGVYDGGAGIDTVSYEKTTGPINANLSVGFGDNGDTFAGIENLIGGSGNNTLIGDAGANRLIGGVLGDLLDGGRGGDYMAGGNGSDIYFVDNAADVVVELANQGVNDEVRSTVSYKLGDNVENLTLEGTASINGTGNALNNNIYGNAGANVIDGGVGNDVLRGAGGADILTGGAGKDVFQFIAASDSKVSAVDHIIDFTRGEDRLDFKSIDSNSATKANDAFKFIGTDAFSNKAGELRYEAHNGYTLVQGDVNGDGMADFAISLDSYNGALKSSDFVL